MCGQACEWIYVTRSITSALVLLPGKSWWSPLDLSFSPLTSRLATPFRESGCMNVEAAQLAASLAFIALRIHTALTAPCPGKYFWLVAVNVLILFYVLPFYPHISTTTAIVCVVDVFFCWPPPPPPLSSLKRGDHVYTGGYDAPLDLRIVSVSDIEGRKRRRCCSADFKKKTVVARRARIEVWLP